MQSSLSFFKSIKNSADGLWKKLTSPPPPLSRTLSGSTVWVEFKAVHSEEPQVLYKSQMKYFLKILPEGNSIKCQSTSAIKSIGHFCQYFPGWFILYVNVFLQWSQSSGLAYFMLICYIMHNITAGYSTNKYVIGFSSTNVIFVTLLLNQPILNEWTEKNPRRKVKSCKLIKTWSGKNNSTNRDLV